MKRRFIGLLCLLGVTLLLGACSSGQAEKEDRLKVGIMLSNDGLGDQSFNDTAFEGMIKARDELDVQISYKELKDVETYENGFKELYAEKNDLIIGLGFETQPELEKIAKKYPKQAFLLIDGVSEIPNVHSITFKEKEGSYIIGMIAGMKTKTNEIGFVGGMEIDVVKRFEEGFIEGVKSVNPKANLHIEYAGTFGDDKVGAKIAEKMTKKDVDMVYPAAGFTGYGVLKKAEEKNIYSFGVDTDQYYIAEKTVVASMLKKVDVAIYGLVKEYQEKGKLEHQLYNWGIKEGAIGISPVRILPLTPEEEQKVQNYIKEVEAAS